MILELLDVPPGVTTKEGTPARSYHRATLPAEGLMIGGSGADLVVPDVREAYCRISCAGAEPRVTHVRRTQSQLGSNGLITLTIDASKIALRVVKDDEPAAGWPDLPQCRAVESAAPGTGSLDVLADALLELGHPLGERLRAGTSTGEDDDRWLAHLGGLLGSGELLLTWRRAIAEQAVVRGASSPLASLGGHALLHLVQRLDLLPWTESTPHGPQRMLDLLAESTFPWLEELRLHQLSARELNAIGREFKTRPNWRRAFPRLRAPILLRQQRLGVETAGKVEEVGERSVHLDAVVDTGTIPVVRHWVRMFQGAVMLGTSSTNLVFNGRALQRPAGAASTWTILLMAGDEFFLEGKARRIVSLGPKP